MIGINLPAYERSYSSLETEALVEKAAIHLRSTARLEFHEISVERKVGMSAQRDGEEVAMGFGKGSDSRIGAFGECVEHYHWEDSGRDIEARSRMVTREGLPSNDLYISLAAKLMEPTNEIRVFQFEQWGTGDPVAIPSSLVVGATEPVRHRKYDNFLARYASSSGTAFGFRREDAVLHSTLEVIERDQISKLFLAMLGQDRHGLCYSVFDSYRFCDQIEDITAELETYSHTRKVTTLLRATEFGAFFSFSFYQQTVSGKLRVFWGAGCSLYRDLAIYRSVAECQQSSQYFGEKVDDKVHLLAECFPDFHRISTLDLSAVHLVPFSPERETPERLTVGRQLETIVARLHELGQSLAFYEHTDDCPYHVISCFIPNMERFFGIIFGLQLAPLWHLAQHLDADDEGATRE